MSPDPDHAHFEVACRFNANIYYSLPVY